jgi:hypothetical protein
MSVLLFVLSRSSLTGSCKGWVGGYGILQLSRGVRIPHVGAKRAARLKADVEFVPVQAVCVHDGVVLHLVNSQT